MVPVALTMTAAQHEQIRGHLFPGDSLEAVALLLCGRRAGVRHRLIVREVFPVPYSACLLRAPDRVTWSTEGLPAILEKAVKYNYAVVKIHGHHAFDSFSVVDDGADEALFPSIFAWIGGEAPHASAIMLDADRIFGRAWFSDGSHAPLERVSVIGQDIKIWHHRRGDAAILETGRRVAQTFGARTFDILRRLKIGVVGCSGTGSPTVEMLARNCVGELVLVDPDAVEEKNLNRIINATAADARAGRAKVAVLAEAIQRMGVGCQVTAVQENVFATGVVDQLADCDVLFGCVDSIDGRHLLNRLATFYSIPYFDLGVKLEADGAGGVDQVCGSVHYLRPGGSSLLSRHVYTSEQVRAAGLARTDPTAYRRQVSEGYIRGVAENRPAVIQLNTLIASLAVNELLARLHPYRLDKNEGYAIRRISLSHDIFEHAGDGTPCPSLTKHVGRGDAAPRLDWPELSIAGACR
ncbi:MAG: ThiF family adenylyltransferase [Hyphomonadaceae bacterium]|nr:ThiF family adenylyltransferase [Hyphomonadaceae bacterium]